MIQSYQSFQLLSVAFVRVRKNNMVAIQLTRCLIMTPLNLITTSKLYHVGREANCTNYKNTTHPNTHAQCQNF